MCAEEIHSNRSQFRSRSPLRNFYQQIRESLAGTEHDFTAGPLGKAVFLLAVPMVLELALQSVFSVIDVFFVARLGADAVAAVGITESILTLVFAVAMGLSMGTTAMVSRRIGEKNAGAASQAAGQAILLGVLLSLPISLIGIFFSTDILAMMGASAGVVQVGTGYFTWMVVGNITIMLLFLINAIFRGAGDAATAMRVLWLSNLLNIILDPLLIFGIGPFPELGTTGAAVATNLARGIAIVYQLGLLFSGKSRVVLIPRQIHGNLEVMARLLRLSGGGVLQFLIATSSWIALVRLIALFGSEVLAGYTIALRIILFALLPSWGMSNAAATLVGQNLGAGKPERAERSVWMTGVANMIFLGMVAIVFIVYAEPITRLFTADPKVVPAAVDCLRLISYGYIFYAYGMVIVQSFNGAGDTYTPTVINFFCYWLFQLPVAYLMAFPLGLGAAGVFGTITISESLLAVVSVAVFRRGTWKSKIV